jgi:hypothetical protein
MLNGIDPVFIFNFSKLVPDVGAALGDIPIVSKLNLNVPLPPIPIYLSEKLTGIYIDSEDKNVDVETSTETLATGATPVINQKGINSTVRINMFANKNSIGMTLLSAMIDLIYDKVTSKEYSIYYFHGPITVFGGLLHSFSISQNSTNELYNITLELTRSTIKATTEKAKIPSVTPDPNAVIL